MSEGVTARKYLSRDVKRWCHSESLLLLANIDRGPVAAKNYLETMLARLPGSLKYNYRKHQRLIRSAQQMLKTLV